MRGRIKWQVSLIPRVVRKVSVVIVLLGGKTNPSLEAAVGYLELGKRGELLGKLEKKNCKHLSHNSHRYPHRHTQKKKETSENGNRKATIKWVF